MWVLERVRNRERENSPKDFFYFTLCYNIKAGLIIFI